MPVSASTSSVSPITLDVGVSGIGLSQLEAQKLAKQMQESLCYHLGCKAEDLVVNISADAGNKAEEPEMTPAEFADKAVADAAVEAE